MVDSQQSWIKAARPLHPSGSDPPKKLLAADLVSIAQLHSAQPAEYKPTILHIYIYVYTRVYSIYSVI